MYEIERIIIEVTSAILYFILVKYMIKPYTLTREGRYIGLPLGFAFLGISETIMAIGITQPLGSVMTLSLLMRTFAFIFLAITYYFSKKPSQNSRTIWNVTLSVAIVALATLGLILISTPLLGLDIPVGFGIYLRLLDLVGLTYIILHTLHSHIKAPDPTTIWIPLGFILLAISQYSQVIRVVDGNYGYGLAFVGGLVARFAGIAVFLYVTYRAFYKSKKAGLKNENRS